MHKLNCFVLTTALICSAGSAIALEATATNDIRGFNSGLEKRMEAGFAALTAAFNNLKGTIDDLVARVGVLEVKMDDVKTKQPLAWNTPLESRLNGIESTNAAQTTAINTSTTKNNTQDNRLDALENRGAASGIPVPDLTNCSKIKTSSSQGRMIMCPAGRVIVGISNEGLAVTAKTSTSAPNAAPSNCNNTSH